MEQKKLHHYLEPGKYLENWLEDEVEWIVNLK